MDLSLNRWYFVGSNFYNSLFTNFPSYQDRFKIFLGHCKNTFWSFTYVQA
jgi:hypothetical protein